MPGATKPMPFDAGAFARLDREISNLFTPEELITPDEVKGAYPTLREAVRAGAWPSLTQARGKVIFMLDDIATKGDAVCRTEPDAGGPSFVRGHG